MSHLKDRYETFISTAESKGEKFLLFKCPECNAKLKTFPNLGYDNEDSFCTCPYCESQFLKVVHPHNTVTIYSMKELR
jgi:uncharacterized protein with PIN domain